MLGIALAIMAAFSWSIGTIFARLGLQGIKASTGTLISMFSSTLVVGLLALSLKFNEMWHLSAEAVLWFSLIGLVNFVLGRQLNFAAVSHIGASKATALFTTAPLFAMILAVALIGERVNPAIVGGTLIIIAGIFLVATSQ